VNQYILGQFIGLLKQFWGLHGALLILAGAFVLYELYLDRLSVYSVWLVAAAGTAVLSGKWGAGDSYFATAIAALCILAGLFAGRALKGEWRSFSARATRLLGRLSPLLGLTACALFVLYGLAVIKLPLDGPVFGPLTKALNIQSNTKFANFYDSAGWTVGYATIGNIPTASDVENGWRIVNTVKGDPRPILSEEAAFSFRANKPIISNPTQLLNLYQNNHYDPAALVNAIDNQEFGAVIFRARFYPQPVLDAVDRAYRIKEVIPMNGFQYTILEPDPTWPSRKSGRN
jgi:hypothetical protein